MNTKKVVPNDSGFVFDEDDLPVGRILSRREALALMGGAGGALVLTACAPPTQNPAAPSASDGLDEPIISDESIRAGESVDSTVSDDSVADLPAVEEVSTTAPPNCVVRPEMTEGPLFVDDDLNRSDIRTDPSNGQVSAGVPLTLAFNVSSIANAICTPLAGIQVDIWQCDANGVYSDTSMLGMSTSGQKFLRGFQFTDESGVARFTTIYPGWYRGRAVHIHFKMRTADGYDFTSQLFFDETLNDQVFAQAPYNSRGERSLRNENDGIFGQSGGQMILAVGATETGYTAVFDVALDLT